MLFDRPISGRILKSDWRRSDVLFVKGAIAMRSATFLLCVFGWPLVAEAQVGVTTGTRAYPSDRAPIFVGPSYRNTGGAAYFSIPLNTTATVRIPQAGSAYWSDSLQPPSPSTGSPRLHATYFHNPYYPSLNFTPSVDIRPQEYVIPPVTRTPLHDPYFEERVYEDFEDEYEYWGW
jgi:hypothetical protein